jgi:hypothetical protein
MICMLVVLVMVIQRMRDPAMWQWLEPDRSVAHAHRPPDRVPPKHPAASPNEATAAEGQLAFNAEQSPRSDGSQPLADAAPAKKPVAESQSAEKESAEKESAEKESGQPHSSEEPSSPSPAAALDQAPEPNSPKSPEPEQPPPAERKVDPGPPPRLDNLDSQLTDEDSDEATEFAKNIQAITDGTKQIQKEEMWAYQQLVRWVLAQPLEVLERRSTAAPRYNWFAIHPEQRRGKLYSLDLDLRMSDLYQMPGQTPGENIYLVEAWGATTESRGRPFDVIIVDPPEGFPVKPNIRERVVFSGYFLKMQGYEPGSAKPGDKPLRAPLLIGRIEWKKIVPIGANRSDLIWLSAAGGLIALFLLVWLVRSIVQTRRGVAAVSSVTRARTPEAEVQDWLHQAYDPQNQPEPDEFASERPPLEDSDPEASGESPWRRDF